jgi:hypothetical protein
VRLAYIHERVQQLKLVAASMCCMAIILAVGAFQCDGLANVLKTMTMGSTPFFWVQMGYVAESRCRWKSRLQLPNIADCGGRLVIPYVSAATKNV